MRPRSRGFLRSLLILARCSSRPNSATVSRRGSSRTAVPSSSTASASLTNSTPRSKPKPPRRSPRRLVHHSTFRSSPTDTSTTARQARRLLLLEPHRPPPPAKHGRHHSPSPAHGRLHLLRSPPQASNHRRRLERPRDETTSPHADRLASPGRHRAGADQGPGAVDRGGDEVAAGVGRGDE